MTSNDPTSSRDQTTSDSEAAARHRAARDLAGKAETHVGRADGCTPMTRILRRISRGRFGRSTWNPEFEDGLTAPWRDTPAYGRPGWRERAGYIGDEEVFAVDYTICARCGAGWVEMPYTYDGYTRCGLATAALSALRAGHPGLSWYTAGGHYRDAEAFWVAAGQGVSGGYRARQLCSHDLGL
ncbi:hypothetical protein [Kribbella italica]|uniref:Uncharacterized protein n=1 Tax=Kribbella italica TaxID=1540520 RepID=A0A7W9JER7_9ACTN|nr:hypothetical protein [Kribbella italica]MBB5840620.1 hypothetical protein [Kribbella italica]